jgi:archaellum biogenesis protein FlaJ (TadC family)
MPQEKDSMPDEPLPKSQSLGVKVLLIAIGVFPFFGMVILRHALNSASLSTILIILAGLIAALVFIGFIPAIAIRFKRSALEVTPIASNPVPNKLTVSAWAELNERWRAKITIVIVATFTFIFVLLFLASLWLQVRDGVRQLTSTFGTLILLAISAALTLLSATCLRKRLVKFATSRMSMKSRSGKS